MDKENPYFPYQSVLEMVDAVKKGESRAQELLYALLQRKTFSLVRAYIFKNNGSLADAEDIFQDAVIVVLQGIKKEKLQFPKFSRRSPLEQLSAYLMKSGINLWRKELRWRSRPPVAEKQYDAPAENQPLSMIVADTMQAINPECRKLFRQVFQKKISFRKIAAEWGESFTTNEVKKRLADCTNALLKQIGSQANQEQDLLLFKMTEETVNEFADGCKSLLSAFYHEKLSMTAIAERLDYANAHSAREQKRKCMRKLYLAVAEKLILQQN